MKLSVLRNYFDGLQQREQKLLLLLGALVTVVFLWLAIGKPVETAKENNTRTYRNAHEGLLWMQEHVTQARALSGSHVRIIPSGSSLLSLASEMAKKEEITVNHAEPEGDRAVRMLVEDASFKNVLLWLDALQREYHIAVKTITISPLSKNPSEVSISVTLTD